MKLDLNDLICLIGLIVMGVGMWMVSPPWALIILGALIIVTSSASAARKGGDNK